VFACLRLTGWAETVDSPGPALLDVAQQFSPRVAWTDANALVADVRGLERLFGDARAIGDELRRALSDRGLHAHIAIAATSTAARLLAEARAGVTVIASGEERGALAGLPIDLVQVVTEGFAPRQAQGERNVLTERNAQGERPEAASGTTSARFYRMSPVSEIVRARRRHSRAEPSPLFTFRRWGLRTLGDLAGLPPSELAARLGREGPMLQAIARGEDHGPLVPVVADERFEATLALEWPIEGLEPLSFVLSRLADPVCADLDRCGRAAAAISVELRLVSRETWVRRQDLPTPIKDPRTLRTLVLLDLESHPPPAAIDAVTLRADPTPARTLQHSLLERARPAPEQISTLVARLTALMGERRVGTPIVIDSHRPDAVRMTIFTGEEHAQAADARRQTSDCQGTPAPALRRLRQPAAATVTIDEGRPIRLRVSRPGLPEGRVETCAGPWRTSGEWWSATAWDRDEWDVALDGGVVCRLFRDRRKDRWFVEGVYD
jgi:protein ImuB